MKLAELRSFCQIIQTHPACEVLFDMPYDIDDIDRMTCSQHTEGIFLLSGERFERASSLDDRFFYGEDAVDGPSEFGKVDGLFEEVAGAGTKSLKDNVLGFTIRDEDDRYRRKPCLNISQRVKAFTHFRTAIEQDDVRLALFDGLYRFRRSAFE